MKTYYRGDNGMPDGWYWICSPSCEEPWVIEQVVNMCVDSRTEGWLRLWDVECDPDSKAVGPLEPPR